MLAIVIACYRDGDPADAHGLWADIRVAMSSVEAYAPGVEVVLAWRGPCAPTDLPRNPCAKVVRQPDGCATFGEAFGFAVTQTAATELVLMNDDSVLTPAPGPRRREAAAGLRRAQPALRRGVLAARAPVAPAEQNIRSANGGELHSTGMCYDSEDDMIAVDRISPVVAYITRSALDDIGGFPPINWLSDDLMCFDLMSAGYTNFVSRAYVHHIGQRASTQGGSTTVDLLRDGFTWVAENRPDFHAYLLTRQALAGAGHS